jgi:Methyl-accepting chemotaxis protein (MCP) signalling domain
MSIIDVIRRRAEQPAPDKASSNGTSVNGDHTADQVEPDTDRAHGSVNGAANGSAPPTTASLDEPAGAASLLAARDDAGVWDLTVLANDQGEAGTIAKEFAEAVDELEQTVTGFSIGAARSAVSVGVIGSEVERLLTELEDVAGRVDSLRASSEQASREASETAEVASELSGEAERGLAVVGRVIDAVSEMQEHTARVADLLDGLVCKELADIGKSSSLIDGVARQTKLLALNAAIEAARAGEHGRWLRCRGRRGRAAGLGDRAADCTDPRDDREHARPDGEHPERSRDRA